MSAALSSPCSSGGPPAQPTKLHSPCHGGQHHRLWSPQRHPNPLWSGPRAGVAGEPQRRRGRHTPCFAPQPVVCSPPGQAPPVVGFAASSLCPAGHGAKALSVARILLVFGNPKRHVPNSGKATKQRSCQPHRARLPRPAVAQATPPARDPMGIGEHVIQTTKLMLKYCPHDNNVYRVTSITINAPTCVVWC